MHGSECGSGTDLDPGVAGEEDRGPKRRVQGQAVEAAELPGRGGGQGEGGGGEGPRARERQVHPRRLERGGGTWKVVAGSCKHVGAAGELARCDGWVEGACLWARRTCCGGHGLLVHLQSPWRQVPPVPSVALLLHHALAPRPLLLLLAPRAGRLRWRVACWQPHLLQVGPQLVRPGARVLGQAWGSSSSRARGGGRQRVMTTRTVPHALRRTRTGRVCGVGLVDAPSCVGAGWDLSRPTTSLAGCCCVASTNT